MKYDILIKRIAVLEKRIEYLESKLAPKSSTSSRDENGANFVPSLGFKKKILPKSYHKILFFI